MPASKRDCSRKSNNMAQRRKERQKITLLVTTCRSRKKWNKRCTVHPASHSKPHPIGDKRSKQDPETAHSDSLPELSSSELESDEWSWALAGGGGADAVVALPPPLACSKRAICASSLRMRASSTSSSMLLRFKPPVPVPLPVRARFGACCAFRGRMTRL